MLARLNQTVPKRNKPEIYLIKNLKKTKTACTPQKQ